MEANNRERYSLESYSDMLSREIECVDEKDYNVVVIISVAPISFIILLDGYQSWLRRDILNMIRHFSVVGPFLAIFLKILILIYKRHQAKQVIDEINRDYASYNHLPPSYRITINTHLRNSLFYTEKCWAFTVLISVGSYVAIPVVLNIHSILFKEDPIIYMAHDVNKPFAPPEERFESPFFEIIFAYICYAAMCYLINFSGFDGFFGLVINHACLKMDLYCKAFEEAMRAKDKEERHKRLMTVIKQQNSMFAFVDLIQDTFNTWLALILIATMIQVCNCMYQITEANELDLRFVVFVMGTIIHFYLPCRYSSKLKHKSMQTATMLYCGGWERVYDVSVRRALIIMMTRAQVPLGITAFNLLVFDMELFVSLLKTSYSMYTLLRS